MIRKCAIGLAAGLLALAGEAMEIGSVPVWFHYRGDVRTAYLSRGKLGDDRPIQSNIAEIGFPLKEFGEAGFWHFNYNSLTRRMRGTRDWMFAESDWCVWYSYDWKLADEWALSAMVAPRWFFLPYWNEDKPMIFEWHWTAELKNPYVTPMAAMRRGVIPDGYLYFRTGLLHKFQLTEDLACVPGFFVDLGDENQVRKSNGSPANGGHYPQGLLGFDGQVRFDWRLNGNVLLFATVEEFVNGVWDARDRLPFPNHREQTIFSVGVDVRF